MVRRKRIVEIALRYGMYAYDAYLIACALAVKAPLLTLDSGLRRTAAGAGAEILELA